MIGHGYGDKKVRLDVRLVEGFEGKAHHQEGQQSLWVNICDLNNFTFPDANMPIINKLVGLVAGNNE